MNSNQINELTIEDIILIIFIILSLLNIYGNYFDKLYLKTKNTEYKKNANYIFLFTLVVTFFIYIYFFNRNYNNYKSADESEKNLYGIKVLGSTLLLIAILLLIYFQGKQTSFIGSPAI